jgi:hypothetical protein
MVVVVGDVLESTSVDDDEEDTNDFVDDDDEVEVDVAAGRL